MLPLPLHRLRAGGRRRPTYRVVHLPGLPGRRVRAAPVTGYLTAALVDASPWAALLWLVGVLHYLEGGGETWRD